jgi:hypothetical protein
MIVSLWDCCTETDKCQEPMLVYEYTALLVLLGRLLFGEDQGFPDADYGGTIKSPRSSNEIGPDTPGNPRVARTALANCMRGMMTPPLPSGVDT